MNERQIMVADEVRRAIARLAHEIGERNGGVQNVVLVGIYRRGIPLAKRIAAAHLEHPIAACENTGNELVAGERKPQPFCVHLVSVRTH